MGRPTPKASRTCNSVISSLCVWSGKFQLTHTRNRLTPAYCSKQPSSKFNYVYSLELHTTLFFFRQPPPQPAPTVPCPSWMSAWLPEISELLALQSNRSSFFLQCAATTLFLVHANGVWFRTGHLHLRLVCVWLQLRGTPRGSRKKPNASR